MAYIKDDLNGVNLYSGVLNLPQELYLSNDTLKAGNKLTLQSVNAQNWSKIDHIKIYLIQSGSSNLQRYLTITSFKAGSLVEGMFAEASITSAYPKGEYIAVISGTKGSKVQERSELFSIV